MQQNEKALKSAIKTLKNTLSNGALYFFLCAFPTGFKQAGAPLEKCDVMYLHAPIRFKQHLNQNPVFVTVNQSTPTQSR